MKYIDEYRNKDIVQYFAGQIKSISTKTIRIMEVCGGHTMSIQKFGLPYLLPETVELVSGPGCPVCVTSREYIDKAIAYSRLDNVIITTFGDLIRVPGSSSTLEKEKASGADVRIVYSILDAMLIAKKNKSKKIVFLGIGFETTAPSSAAGILKARTAGLKNFYVYSAHKVMPPAMEALIDDGVNIDGYIGPGHVSTITGQSIYMNIPKKYNMGVVISGFEPVDIMQSIHMLVTQIENNDPKVEIQYTRVVKPEGNIVAQQMLEEIFEYRDDWWRGLGILKNSGLNIKKDYEMHDAEKMIEVEVEETVEPVGCICGLILRGEKKPKDCGLFGKVCTPTDPVGACMVSNEGSCHAYYLYNR
ncbi:MAG: hydrogenase formation protein HypD [Bacteroidetes bacterium]|nr:hydrogenase formation protein HypD [Bacteroidota bacterium]|tara:strand:- start:726 stop:1805 length:1080 start_codon:yes stop_codon:yes gene_type:complete